MQDLRMAEKLTKLADRMGPIIEAKLNPAIANQNWTARRARIAESMRAEGYRMERIQTVLYGLAQGHRNGTIHPLLAKIKNKAEVETLLETRYWPDGAWAGDESKRKRLTRLGLCEKSISKAYELISLIADRSPDREREREIRELENEARALVGKIPGFFPTPRDVVEQMLDLVRVNDSDVILEPSAGSGAILDVVRELYPSNPLTVIEWNLTLQNLLTKKGYQVEADDFMAYEGEHDVILMNPPFERGQDIEHTRHAFDCLAEGGRMVSVLSEGAFFRSDSKAEGFREWLSWLPSKQVDLPAGAFSESGTNVKARLVMIEKR